LIIPLRNHDFFFHPSIKANSRRSGLLLLLVSYFFLSHDLQAQSNLFAIKGKVTTTSNEKLDAAVVVLADTDYKTLTNADGGFEFKGVTPGTYHLVCSYLGYKDQHSVISITNSDAEFIQIVMQPDPMVLNEAVIIAQKEVNTVQRMPEIEGTMIYAAKRNDVIQLDRQNSNTAQVVQRQIFSKVPGVNLWEFDGSGNQISIGTRGLNPHRSIEMNVRQNEYVINSDLFGYPEAHYTPAIEGVKKIEVIRGSAALQYGPQFGGLINYIMREGDPHKPFIFQTQQTIGSDRLLASFNSIGGTKGKWNYYAYFNARTSTGYRPNNTYHNFSGYAAVKYDASSKLSVKLEYSYLDYVNQLAGGLSDSMFHEDPYQSTRARNYFQPHFDIPALTLNLKLNENTSISLVSNYLFGQRNSVMYIQLPTVKDSINPITLEYSPRQVDRDWYHSWTNEARLLQKYQFLQNTSSLTVGARYSDSRTRRAQRAPGTTGTDFDLSTTGPYLTELKFVTRNYAFFAENLFHIGERFSLTPGARIDILETTSSGTINYLPAGLIVDKNRNVPLLGCGAQYDLSNLVNIYSNVSQAYRPVQYNDLIPLGALDQIDPDMKDAHGFQFDLGIRGSIQEVLRFDAGLYYLSYQDRIGTLLAQDNNGNHFIYKTNTGNSTAQGIEVFVEFHPLHLYKHNSKVDISIFTSTSTDHAVYTKGSTLIVNGENEDITGNKLENAPTLVSRSGITYSFGQISTTLLYSYTSAFYSDARNIEFVESGITGLVPGYGLFDLSGVIDFGKLNVTGGINNLTNVKYFTRRISTYPGPGILPGDGLTFYLGVGLKID
jgi:Fe(3+) dicitrate transport protein